MDDDDGQSLGAWIIVRDISISKMNERILRENEAKFRSLFEDSPIAIALFDAEGSLVLANRATLQLFGIADVNEIMGHNLFTDPDVPDQIKEELHSGNPVKFTREYDFGLVQDRNSYKTSRSDVVHIEVVGAPYGLDSEGNSLGFTLQMQDVSEGVDVFQLLKRQKEELSHFTHDMKHDITTHLIKMHAYTELLESDYSIDDVKRMKLAIQELRELLHHSVELAEAGEIIESKSKVDLNDVVRRVATTGLNNDVVFVQGDLPIVQGDSTKIAQVFRNLFDNAILHGKAKRIHVFALSPSNGHIISISNDGGIIPNKIRSKIFERGFSSEESHAGYGLTIVQKIVEAHGWTISLKDASETVFEIIIPFEVQ
jgi:PAS domain S-box-containing protein